MTRTPIIDNLINELEEQGFEIGVFTTDADKEYYVDYRIYDFAKKRHRRISRVLNRGKAEKIRVEYNNGNTIRKLAKMYSVSDSAIHHIITYKNYKV